jgi:hypothetical protein
MVLQNLLVIVSTYNFYKLGKKKKGWVNDGNEDIYTTLVILGIKIHNSYNYLKQLSITWVLLNDLPIYKYYFPVTVSNHLLLSLSFTSLHLKSI